MTTIYFTDAEGVMRTEQNVTNVRITDEPMFNLIIQFTNGSHARFNDNKKAIIERISDIMDNENLNSFSVIPS